MLIYDVEDCTGAKTRHLAVGKESAIQAHLVHLGLSYLKEPPKVSGGKPLNEFTDRSSICWDVHCCMVAASSIQEGQ
jgi:hypothetical protein